MEDRVRYFAHKGMEILYNMHVLFSKYEVLSYLLSLRRDIHVIFISFWTIRGCTFYLCSRTFVTTLFPHWWSHRDIANDVTRRPAVNAVDINFKIYTSLNFLSFSLTSKLVLVRLVLFFSIPRTKPVEQGYDILCQTVMSTKKERDQVHRVW